MEPITTAVQVVTINSDRIVHHTEVDLVFRKIPNVIKLVQYDTTLPIIAVDLKAEGINYVLPQGAACNIRLKKPDGTIVYDPAYGCDSTRTVVYFEVTLQMTAVMGDLDVVVEIVSTGKVAGTSPLWIKVDRNPIQEDDIESQDETQTIIGYVGEAQQARDDAIAAKEDAQEMSYTAEAWAVGTKNGIDVGSSDPQYHNNSKYYKEQAEAVAESIPEDYSELSDDVDQLKNALGFSKIKTLSTITGANKWAKQTSGYSYVISVKPNSTVRLMAGASSAILCILKTITNIDTVGDTPDYATGYSSYTTVTANTTATITMPADAYYLFIYGNAPGQSDDYYYPVKIEFDDYADGNMADNINVLHSIIKNKSTRSIGTRYFANNENLTDNYYVKATTGLLISNNYYKATDYIPTVGNTIGVSRGVGQFACYDANKIFISGESISTSVHDYQEYSLPNGTSFVRLSFDKSYDVSKEWFVFGNGIDAPLKEINVSTTTTDIPGFTTLRGAVAYAIQYEDVKVFVEYGTYNLATEFATEISANQANVMFGIGLCNGVHIVFASGVKVVAKYAGSEQNIVKCFNPFYAINDGSYTLENLDIEAENTRYCLHDEMGGTAVNARIAKIINCRMSMDNTTAPLNWYPQCIGGGNGKHDYVVIESCWFKSKVAESSPLELVSYHNNGSYAYSQANIHIRDCYFADKGRVRISYYGTSELVSDCYISNCSLGSEPVVTQEAGGSAPENYQLITWLNEIRN